MSKFALDKIAATFPRAFLDRYTDRAGGEWAVIDSESIRDVASELRDNPELDFKLFLSIDAVDRLMLPEHEPRFEIGDTISMEEGLVGWSGTFTGSGSGVILTYAGSCCMRSSRDTRCGRTTPCANANH